MSPTDVINAHYAAYGRGDIDALMALYADDFRLGPIGGGPLWFSGGAEGRAAAHGMYAQNVKDWPLAKSKTLFHAAIGAHVAREDVSEHADGARTARAFSVYTVKDGRIAALHMIPDEPAAPPLDLVARQLEAYNAQDLDAHCACFAEDVAVANVGEAPNLTGIADYRARYEKLFAEFPQNHAELVGRMVIGEKIVDHERVRRSPDSAPFEVLAIYSFAGGKIARVDFVR